MSGATPVPIMPERPLFSLAELETAARLVHAVMPATPQYAWPLLAERAGCTVWVKHENHTPTGAFKVRGGLVYMDWLRRQHPAVTSVISATRGNHGQSVAFAAARHGLRSVIAVPEGNSVEKNAAMQAFGAELVVYGEDFDAARGEARRLAERDGHWMLPSFDPMLVRGVATYALELFTAVPDLDVVYVPIGLGSGIAGLIRTRDLLGLKTEIVGVVSEALPAYALSFAAGRIVTTEPAFTIADGMATRIPEPEALEIILKGAARVIRLGETEIKDAIKAYWTDTHNLAEGAGAAPLAGLLQERASLAGKRAAVILCGGNIDLAWFRDQVLA
jgi:threonine dehydratase